MSSTNSIPTSAHPAEPPAQQKPAQQNDERHDSYDRRLKAAGLGPETMPEDIDEFRYWLARKIAMFINDWHGCPERLCQRNRGCMAPNGTCTNAEPLPPDWEEKDWPAAKVEIYKALKERLAEHGEGEEE